MLPYFEKAVRAGYGVLVTNPNMNAHLMVSNGTVEKKMPIRASRSAEEHCLIMSGANYKLFPLRGP
ncbi:hypothetical protein PsorP6_013235 [Peronosclerospora sorghi]|uniref:Uncharacterized protein n=1 Tax=Peronosclerospora sorghi TaxID=230839 RepID=A0ACC0WIN4_9STRA|nr:hypothetical protein PsorP6_013235 [Peronosclerospora sorghi]